MKTPTQLSTQVNPILEDCFEGHRVRAFGTPENPLFVARDVCEVLGLTNVSQAVERVPQKHRSNISSSDIRNAPNRGLLAVTESGLYRLVFQSRKPEAERFIDWVCVVIREIRLKGYYLPPCASSARREALALRFRLAAAEKKVEMLELTDRAKRVLMVPEGISIGLWVSREIPEAPAKQRANIVRSIKRHIERTQLRPVGEIRIGKDGRKALAAHEADIITAATALRETREDIRELWSPPAAP